MSANRRSSGTAGRPCGRPAGPGFALRRLVALVAIGAIAALVAATAATAQGGDEAPAPDPVQTASAPAPEPAPPAPEPAPPPTVPQPPSPPPVQTQDPPPAAVQGPQWEGSASYEGSSSPANQEADPDPSQGGDAGSSVPPEQPEGPPREPPAGADSGTGTGTAPDAGAGAQNQSRVLQAIVQVQVGCRTYCHGTSQDQSASQASDTRQEATAVGPDGSSAVALNESSTLQFVWQMQVGCVAFCWDTTMNQSASQDARTTQTATAVSDVAARATNVGETIQYVWQLQHGCQVECYGVNESQSLSQRQSTSQSATATGPDYPTGWSPDGPGGLPPWLTAFAESIGATIQTIFQYQEASCLEHCGEEALAQEATQQAATDQTSRAGDVPEPPAPPPDASEPPPAAEEPPAGAPAPGSATTTATAAASAALSGTGPARADEEGGSSVFAKAKPRRSERAEARRTKGSVGGAPSSGTGDPEPGAARDSTPASTRSDSRLEAPASGGSPGKEKSSTSEGGSTSQPNATSPVAGAGGPTRGVDIDRTATTDSGDGPNIPWLAVVLLVVAGAALVQTFRPRPGLRA